MQTLHSLHMEDTHTVHHREVRWILVAKVPVVSVVDTDTDIQAPVLPSGTANTSCLEVAGKVVAVAGGTVEAAVEALCVVGGEPAGLRLGRKEALRVVVWAEQRNRFATQGRHIHYIADMAFGV